MKNKHNNLTSQNGFTLLEIMVAMVIFAVGLLGLAGMQSIAFQNEHSSYSRSQAILLAYEMADRIKANPAGSPAYDISANTLTVADYTGSAMCTDNDCTITDMVKYDMGLWKASLASLLPSGLGSLSRTVAVGNTTQTITVHWDEDRTGATGLNCPVVNKDDLRCFQLSVRL